MRGPKPKAREVQLAEGRDQKNPHRFRNEVPKTLEREPAMPEHFDEQAQEAWQFLKELLTGAKMWSATYQVTIEMYCETYSNYRRALHLVKITGQALRTESKDGSPEIKRNPYSVELHRYKDELLKLSAEFGLTPSSRSRISLESGSLDSDNPLVRLMA